MTGKQSGRAAQAETGRFGRLKHLTGDADRPLGGERSKYTPHQGQGAAARRAAKRTALIERYMHESELP